MDLDIIMAIINILAIIVIVSLLIRWYIREEKRQQEFLNRSIENWKRIKEMYEDEGEGKE